MQVNHASMSIRFRRICSVISRKVRKAWGTISGQRYRRLRAIRRARLQSHVARVVQVFNEHLQLETCEVERCRIRRQIAELRWVVARAGL